MAGLPLHRETVLVVDDQPASLRLLTDTLEEAGYTVLVAVSGEAAIERLDHIVPDLILMDAVMPGMGGFAATQQLRADPRAAHVPVIFMTGLTDSGHVVEGFAAGGVDYVRKPVDVEELLARVRTHLGRARAVQAGAAALDATGRMMMATDRAGGLLWCTPRAESAIARFAPGWTSATGVLPPMVRSALERLVQRGLEDGAAARIDEGARTLELVAIGHYRENEVLVRLNEFDPQADAARLQARHGLTEREAEVLLWVSYGKSNGDIGEVLGISARTVQKHLERVFEKLGVETRAAAAAIAIRAGGN